MRQLLFRALLLAATVTLAACGGAASAPAANTREASPTTTAATATSFPTSTVAPTASSAATSAATKASANNATAAQLLAAFEAGGVPNASRWVREIEEYRPYPTEDPTFAKLKSNLAKYNPSVDTLQRILAALSLP